MESIWIQSYTNHSYKQQKKNSKRLKYNDKTDMRISSSLFVGKLSMNLLILHESNIFMVSKWNHHLRDYIRIIFSVEK